MKRLLLPLLAALALPTAVNAGLGDAEGLSQKEFDAWCGQAGNNCKVVFSDNRLTVNGIDGIQRDQLIEFSYDSTYNQWDYSTKHFFTLSYKEDGVIKSGTFIFGHGKTSKAFKRALLWFCPKCEKTYNPIDD